MRRAIPVARESALATAGRILLDDGKLGLRLLTRRWRGWHSRRWPRKRGPAPPTTGPACAKTDACEGGRRRGPKRPARRAEWSGRRAPPRQGHSAARPARGSTGRRRSAPTVCRPRASCRPKSRRANCAWPWDARPGGSSPPQARRSRSRARPPGYRFRGVGYGHGVGLCVIGAGHRAARGESATQILARLLRHAHRGCGRLAPSRPRRGPRLRPPCSRPRAADCGTAGRRHRHPAGAARCGRARARGGRRPDSQDPRGGGGLAGVPEPLGLTVTVHPTVESFGRATGQPWWVAAPPSEGDRRAAGVGAAATRRPRIHGAARGRARRRRPVPGQPARLGPRGSGALLSAAADAAPLPAGRPACPS